MVTAVEKKFMTAEDLAALPEAADGTRYELIRGGLVAMSPAGTRHGVCCLTVGSLLRAFVQTNRLGVVAANDPGVITQRNPDSVRAPDVAYWSRERLPEVPVGFTEVAPDLAVEVVSPNDTHGRLHEKVLHYLDHGVRLVWVVDPETRTATVYHSRDQVRILSENDVLSGDDVLPAFSCRVVELFE